MYVVSMVVVATSQVMAVQQALHVSFTTAMRVHTSVIGAVYTKVKTNFTSKAYFTLLESALPASLINN